MPYASLLFFCYLKGHTSKEWSRDLHYTLDSLETNPVFLCSSTSVLEPTAELVLKTVCAKDVIDLTRLLWVSRSLASACQPLVLEKTWHRAFTNTLIHWVQADKSDSATRFYVATRSLSHTLTNVWKDCGSFCCPLSHTHTSARDEKDSTNKQKEEVQGSIWMPRAE